MTFMHTNTTWLQNSKGQSAVPPFYIWASDKCSENSFCFDEAKQILQKQIRAGGRAVHITDATGSEVIDSDIVIQRAKA